MDWDAHGHALKRHRKHRTTLIKYIHKILPIGLQDHRYDPKYPPHCPSCNGAVEDNKHFWRCQAATQLEWRRKFLKDLKAKLIELGTGTQVQHLLISKLQAVLDGEDPDSVPKDTSVADICNKQKQIKWDQLMIGRFATTWSTHPRMQPGIESKSKSRWTTEIIDFIFTQWRQLWELWNQDHHGRDLASKHQAFSQQVDRELIQLYEHEEQVPQHMKWIFDTPIQIRQQWPSYATRQWLNTWYRWWLIH